MFVETFFACFWQFYFLTQSDYFAWAIAFALWPCASIFKMVLFFEYKLFFGAVFWCCFLHRTTLTCSRNVFRMFSAILFFAVFCMGYSLCIVAMCADFQNGLIFHRTTLTCVRRNVFRMFLAILFFDPK